MIKAFHIGNFKAFGPDPQSVPLKPLTIIFGPNSSGKSSILHSLLFAHHAARTGDTDVVYPELAEETVDLGGFRQFIHGAQRGIGNRLSWAAECSARDLAECLDRRRSETNRHLGGPEAHDWRTLLADISTLKIGLTIGIPLDDNGKPTSAARPCVERMECLADQEPIFSGFSVDGKTMRVEQVAAEHPLVERMAGSVAAAETFVLEVSHDMRDRIAREIDSLVDDLRIDADGFLPTRLYDIGARRQGHGCGVDPRARAPSMVWSSRSRIVASCRPPMRRFCGGQRQSGRPHPGRMSLPRAAESGLLTEGQEHTYAETY